MNGFITLIFKPSQIATFLKNMFFFWFYHYHHLSILIPSALPSFLNQYIIGFALISTFLKPTIFCHLCPYFLFDHNLSDFDDHYILYIILNVNGMTSDFVLWYLSPGTTWGLSSLANFLKILSSKRVCYVFRDIPDKNAVNQGFWSKTTVFSLPATKMHYLPIFKVRLLQLVQHDL